MMVGIQGSGKSFFSETKLKPAGYLVASNDKTGSRDKTIAVLKEALRDNKVGKQFYDRFCIFI